MKMHDAIAQAKVKGNWNVVSNAPTSVEVHFSRRNAHYGHSQYAQEKVIDITELDLYAEDKETELEDLWNSLSAEMESDERGVLAVVAYGYISDGEEETA